ncbi:MAG: hypothetical protein RDU24_15875, partial [Humidesulfovibrio sp.]|uniref:hypothetical protein n=1 Tax=Humidesulfovibrio sp. TaxID=2910988 RepID=UPI0027FC3F6D
KKGGDSDWYGYCVDDPVNRVDVWGLDASWIIPERTESPEYYECTRDADVGKHQCDQLFEFLGFATKNPLKGWGVEEIGKQMCKSVRDNQYKGCEDQFGKNAKRENEDGGTPPDHQD